METTSPFHYSDEHMIRPSVIEDAPAPAAGVGELQAILGLGRKNVEELTLFAFPCWQAIALARKTLPVQ